MSDSNSQNTLPSQFEQERKRADIHMPLAMLAGSAIGAGAGLLGVAPYDQYHMHQAEAALAKQRESFMHSQAIWRTLHDLHTGRKSWTELPEEELPTWRSLYEERKSVLSNPSELFRVLNQKPPAEVVRPAAFQQPLWKRLLPSAETMKHPFRTAMKHPVPITLATIGGTIGSLYAQHEHDRRVAELIESRLSGGAT